ncbi:ABC transporter ATP-binding protein [Paenibacillus abyssi]|uniref:ABC transporter ATP-binding protein YxlF n=1 Tax=Paenibacillus abyssi TaxID=1340531 RepID=A0A917D397_9BACL|nr:ABC transporter ATP-binding protein [Paenibacillus abyssi]GGG09239.1 putative ABC transporter ATP-binding protein YxlF [Paenibacillus abyssi]
MALVQVEQLTKTFGSTRAVDGISFAIGQGRCAALLGPNGAGKTTTIRMLTGLLTPTSGKIQFQELRPGADIRSVIGYLPQIPSFYGWMSGHEFLTLAGRLHGLRGKAAVKRSDELLERVGIAGAGRRKIAGYSGGMKQRLGLAQALVQRPKLLALDEPVSALDPVGRREVLELLRELKHETTVLFSTHVLHDAEELCDDVLIVRDGKIALQGAIGDIRAQHQKPVLLLQTEADEVSKRWLAEWNLRERPYIVDKESAEDRLRLVVSDIDTARSELLEELSRSQVKVRRLEIGHTSLEDLFMKVVTG